MGGVKAWKNTKKTDDEKSPMSKSELTSTNPFDEVQKEIQNRPKKNGVKKFKKYWGKKAPKPKPEASPSQKTAEMLSDAEVSGSKKNETAKTPNPYGIIEVVTEDDENSSTVSPLTLLPEQFKIDISEKVSHTLSLPSLSPDQDHFKDAEDLVYGDKSRLPNPRLARSIGTREEPELKVGGLQKESRKGELQNPIDLTTSDYTPTKAISVGFIEDADEAYEQIIRDSSSLVTKTTHRLFGPNRTWFRG